VPGCPGAAKIGAGEAQSRTTADVTISDRNRVVSVAKVGNAGMILCTFKAL